MRQGDARDDAEQQLFAEGGLKEPSAQSSGSGDRDSSASEPLDDEEGVVENLEGYADNSGEAAPCTQDPVDRAPTGDVLGNNLVLGAPLPPHQRDEDLSRWLGGMFDDEKPLYRTAEALGMHGDDWAQNIRSGSLDDGPEGTTDYGHANVCGGAAPCAQESDDCASTHAQVAPNKIPSPEASPGSGPNRLVDRIPDETSLTLFQEATAYFEAHDPNEYSQVEEKAFSSKKNLSRVLDTVKIQVILHSILSTISKCAGGETKTKTSPPAEVWNFVARFSFHSNTRTTKLTQMLTNDAQTPGGVQPSQTRFPGKDVITGEIVRYLKQLFERPAAGEGAPSQLWEEWISYCNPVELGLKLKHVTFLKEGIQFGQSRSALALHTCQQPSASLHETAFLGFLRQTTVLAWPACITAHFLCEQSSQAQSLGMTTSARRVDVLEKLTKWCAAVLYAFPGKRLKSLEALEQELNIALSKTSKKRSTSSNSDTSARPTKAPRTGLATSARDMPLDG